MITSALGYHFKIDSLQKLNSLYNLLSLICKAFSSFCDCADELLLTHCILVDSFIDICWTSPFVILGVSNTFCYFYSIFDGKSC